MSSPDLTDAEREAVAAVLQTRRLSMGDQLVAFENAVADFVGVRHAVGVSSGTTALHLIVRALGIGDGDLALTTPFSFVASANVFLYERATPIFVDVDPRTGNIDTAETERALADLARGGRAARSWLPPGMAGRLGKVSAILAVDVFGQPPDFDHLASLAREYGIPLIEDSCEALGAQYAGKMAGTLGDAGAFAFYPNKQITTGEGGMVVTDDDEVASLARALRNQGRAEGDTWLEHTHLGYNYRLDELSAALGAVQMTRLEELLGRRERVAGLYAERLVEIPAVEPMPVLPTTTRMSWFVYVVRLAPEIDREEVAAALEAAGVPSRPYFQPIHLQPYFAKAYGYGPGAYPHAEALGRECLALPFSSVMQEAQVERVCQALRRALQAGG